MVKQSFNVPKISRGQCVAKIVKELNEIDGDTQANGDPETKSVTVGWLPPATAFEIQA